ncbi:phage tail tape measure protein [Schinkia azotoformans]|uniref:phage tail tape measure protein n=1 Tax=Schinkia azotoformans TaxID=1454 RepID=UPI002DB70C99|nr:phage tail tape measure protein [Schinkia azotoformans]MEC1772839.1 phage tail tape measure protein [Schinkia azotoformans]MED4367442.1 phage tail tape measure protein [Schinkia azotoformans]
MAYDLGTYGAELVIDSSKFDTGLTNAEDKINQADGKFKLFGSNLGTLAMGAVAGLGTALVGAGAAGMMMTNDLEKSLNQLQASTGATDEEIKGMEESLQNIYNKNLGESFSDIAESMALVQQNTGLAGEELEKTTQNAIMLRDTFGRDVAESTKEANQLMKQFGISSDEAFTLMAQGYQNGLDYAGDFGDSINEYSVYFKQLGFDAEDMFNTFQAGADAGAFNIDKVGDAIKELGIRTKDMSDSSKEGFQSLGLNADDMFSKFAQGGEVAQQATQEVFQKLSEIEDPLLRNQVGVSLMGNQFEDLEATTILALGNVESKFNSTADTLNKINEIKYETFGTAMQGIGRNIQTAFIDSIQEHVLPLMNQFSQYIVDHMPQIQSIISTTFDAIGKVIGGAVTVVKSIISVFQDTSKSTNENFTKVKEIITNIIEIVKKIIGDFVTFATTIWKKYGEDITSFTKTFMEGISQVIGGVLDVIRGIVKTILSLLTGDWKGAWEGIKSITSGVLNVIEGVIKTVTNNIQGILKGAWAVVKNITSVAWEGIKTAITTPIEKAFETVKSIIQKIKDAFNFKLSFPQIKMPHVSVEMKKNSFGIPYPDFDVSYWAKGGIVDKPTLYGNIVGEAGKEAIIPLDNPTYMNPFADAVYKRIADNLKVNNNTNNTNNQNINLNSTFNFEVKGNMDKNQMDKISTYTFEKLTGTLKRYGIKV